LIIGDKYVNVRGPRRMLPPDESRLRQTDGRTPDRCITLSAGRGQRKTMERRRL